MKTILFSNLVPEFSFAGFTFPRYVARIDTRSIEKRKKDRGTVVCGEYFHAPTPNSKDDVGFYLGSDSYFDLRCELRGKSFRFNECGEDITGVVFRLPKNRGFLAGWTMGEGMASGVDRTVFDDEMGASRYADSLAEQAAERERDYQDSMMDEDESEEC